MAEGSPPSYSAHTDHDEEGAIEEVPESNCKLFIVKCFSLFLLFGCGAFHEVDTNYMDNLVLKWSSDAFTINFGTINIVVIVWEIISLICFMVSTLKDKNNQKEYIAEEVYNFPTHLFSYGLVVCSIWVVWVLLLLVSVLFLQQIKHQSLGSVILFYIATILPSLLSLKLVMTIIHVTWARNKRLRGLLMLLGTIINTRQLYLSFSSFFLALNTYQQDQETSVQFLLIPSILVLIIFQIFVDAGLVIGLY